MKKINKKNSQSSKSGPQSNKILTSSKFLPAILVSSLATFLWIQPIPVNHSNTNINSRQANYSVLAYATNTSHSGLLAHTNVQRSAHGVGQLALNSTLNSAAQAKANDMVSRNYWSHQTPDGLEPWVFITNAGYQYLAAGENLAYGFADSQKTVIGWMNSPSHKENLLNSIYTEVGFGMANSANFNGSGPNTVVVALYAKPQNITPAPPSPAPSKTAEVTVAPTRQQETRSGETNRNNDSQNDTPAASAPTDNSNDQSLQNNPTDTTGIDADSGSENKPIAYSSANSNERNIAPKQVSKIQLLTNGNAAWSATLVVLLICSVGLLWLLHRGMRLAQILKNGKQIIGRYLHIDLLILSLIFLAYILLSTSGFIL